MVAIATLLPGCSYASGTFTVPVSALNAALINDMTASDSAEKLIYGLLESLQELQTVGTLSQRSAAVEISNKSVQSSVWEKTLNVFSNVTLISYLVSFAFDTGPSLENANGLSVIG
jgi:hypothetical protein